MKIKYALSILAILALAGCNSPQPTEDDVHILEIVDVTIQEKRDVHFFNTNSNFDISPDVTKKIEDVLTKTRKKNIDNVGIMLISPKPITEQVYNKAKSQLVDLIRKNGFLDSRIKDAGLSIYDGANYGIRVDGLEYEITDPNCDKWDTTIGDVNTDKSLPKYGVAQAYNLAQMIANKADLMSPRTYKGPSTEAAISALSTTSSNNSSSSSSSSSTSN